MKSKFKLIFQLTTFLITLLLAISLIQSILKITGSSQKITDARQKLENLQQENENLARQLKIVASTEFIEKEARDKLGVAKKGEIVVVLPDKETLTALVPKLEEEKFSLPLPIWQKWLNLFLELE